MTPAKSRVFRLTSIYLLGVVAERAAVFLLLPFMTRHLTPSEFGAFSLLVLTGTALNYFVASPPSLALERFFYEPNYQRDRRDLLGSLVTILLGKAAVVAIGFWWMGEYLGDLFLGAEEFAISIQAYTVVVALSPMAIMFLLLLQLTERAVVCVAISTFSACIGSLLSIVLLVRFGFGPEALVFGQIAQYSLVVACTLPFVFLEARWRFRWKTVVEPLRWAYSLLPGAYCELIVQSGDRYLLAAFCGARTVGIYDLGYRVSSVISLILSQPAKRGLHPLILQMEEDPDAQRHFIRSCTLRFYLLGLSLAVSLAVFSREIICLLAHDRSYWAAWTIIPIAAFAYVQHGTGQFLGYGLVMKKKGTIETACLLLSAASNVLLNVVLVRWVGIIGAAVSMLLSVLVWNGLKIYFSRELYGLTFEVRRMGHATAIAVACAVAAVALDIWGGLSPIALICAKTTCIVLLPVGLLVTGFFPRPQLGRAAQAAANVWMRFSGSGRRDPAQCAKHP